LWPAATAIEAGEDDEETTVPQGDALVCNEGANRCDLCDSDADCEDDIECTVDDCTTATGVCSFTADNDRCDDNVFCNGADTCEPDNEDADSSGCVHAGNPCDLESATPACDEAEEECRGCESDTECDDGFDCTVDDCVTGTGECVFTADDDACDADEVCSPASKGADEDTGCAPAP
jgi:hypothetical protein